MASRVLGGNRVPSTAKLRTIHEVYDIPLEDLFEAHAKGAAHFGPWLRSVINSKDAEVEAAAKASATVAEKIKAGK